MAVKYKEYKPDEFAWSNEVNTAQKDADYWKKQQQQVFTYDDFKDSQQTTDFLNRHNNLQGPGDFSFSKQQGWDGIMNKIFNREPFSYDVNGDALYQQYKDQYVNQGKMAMMDTMGQAAAMTGGYGNSYAQSVGQQAYQGYLQQLTDKVPELYQLALSKYQMEGDELYNQYGLYSDQYKNEYGQHRDAVSDYQFDKSHLADMWSKSHAVDMDKYSAGFDKALAENESYNSNIDKNRTFYNDVLNTLKQTEWGMHMDNETLKKIAIEVANDNLYKNEQSRISDASLAEEQRQFNKQFEASTGYTTSGKKSTTFTGDDKADDFKQYTYAGVDADGNSRFYRDGKEYTVEKGTNPYTGTKNSDAKHGTFSNGYQPNNVGGKKLSSVSGLSAEVNGVTQKVWTTDGGKTLYVWDGTKNKYEVVTKEQLG